MFTPNSVRQFLAKFLHLSLKELRTQNKRFQGVVQNSRELLLFTD
eukprot:UN17254